MEESTLTVVNGVATNDSLALVAGKIYAILSDE
jgi:hypothetical protein